MLFPAGLAPELNAVLPKKTFALGPIVSLGT